MQFIQGIAQIQDALLKPLPGAAAQHLMAPKLRKTTAELLLESPSHRLSSVMILLYPDVHGLLSTVFIERPVNLGVHSGQIAFPGGKEDPEDGSPRVTALRETEEEIGIPAAAISVIGSLSPLFIPASNFLVNPYIGVINHIPEFIPSADEVRSLIPAPISEVVAFVPEEKEFKTSYGQLFAPCFSFKGHFIWGATAMIISEFREMLKAR